MPVDQPMKFTMCVLLVLFLLSYGIGSSFCSTIPDNSTDMLALLDFKNAITNDPAGVTSNYWNESTPYCQWEGITCSQRHPGRVTMLKLAGHGLSGPIAASIGNLSFLRILDLSNNNLFGQIPPLGNLPKIQGLNLSSNSLEGNIPEAITNCSSLFSLDLSKNILVGKIPAKIGLLYNLSILVVSSNNLTGSIPPTLSNITNQNVIILSNNKLEGTIPHELGQLSKLTWLSIAGNYLSGEIPKNLFKNMSSLQILGLHSNMLSGTLPPNIGDLLPKLIYLFLGTNMFEGNIPASLGNASMLQQLDLARNNFIGQIPSSFGKLSDLLILTLEINQLEARDNQGWQFLSALGNCRFLQWVTLGGNQLQGVIPDSVGNLSNTLQNLYLGGNNLSGTIPTSIGNLSGLIGLGLDINNFTGTIEWVRKLENLQVLNLNTNNFIGFIPAFIGNFTQLGKLYLHNNKFEGPIPPSFGKLSQLTELNLSYNNLQGEISVGTNIPTQLVQLSLSSNKLNGQISDSFSQCPNLVTIELDHNFFMGNIPISLGNIKGLTLLNLSHNNLSGTIPKSLSDLQLLRRLDLSYNHLYGQVPMHGVFANATDVSLDNNWGLCGGAMDLNMPSCPPASRITERKNNLVKILIPIFGFMSLVLLVYFLFTVRKKTRANYMPDISLGEQFLKVSYNDLAQATRSFSESNLVGRGSCGSVYRGKLKEQKMEIAVKVFDLEMRGAERSFMLECEALKSIQHRNLLPIITACSTVDSTGKVFKALVYEFMPNGSLDTWLHYKEDGKAPKYLGLNQRISIAVNIADALDYLHHDCGRPTVHCDLKPSNILLDDDMTALLGDFGIARFYADPWSASTGSYSSVGVKGTIGYIAPEYGRGGDISPSGDVYSFGIVLLEMMTGKRPTDSMFNDGFDIINFVEGNLPHQISQVIDDHLKEECKEFSQGRQVAENTAYQLFLSLLEVAISCTRPLPNERMNMKQIASRMHTIKTSYDVWKTKSYEL
ncbi:receptor kinase-like protein Xa21 [Oryza brachyantha]|uniref:Receptor kinase-like protein Xa21 n=1 Tax=Oryza brachyantha TaxID=4533 RepID=J3LES5_ORYBR|nr:receptor kinase-like protein Xa21 [Oryza brachyantha]